MVGSRIHRVLLLVIKIRSRRRESAVIRECGRKVGRLAYKEKLEITDNVLAINIRSDSCLQVYICHDRGTICSRRRCVVVFRSEDKRSSGLIKCWLT